MSGKEPPRAPVGLQGAHCCCVPRLAEEAVPICAHHLGTGWLHRCCSEGSEEGGSEEGSNEERDWEADGDDTRVKKD